MLFPCSCPCSYPSSYTCPVQCSCSVHAPAHALGHAPAHYMLLDLVHALSMLCPCSFKCSCPCNWHCSSYSMLLSKYSCSWLYSTLPMLLYMLLSIILPKLLSLVHALSMLCPCSFSCSLLCSGSFTLLFVLLSPLSTNNVAVRRSILITAAWLSVSNGIGSLNQLKLTVKVAYIHIACGAYRDMAMRRIIWAFCRNWFLIDLLHYLSSRSDFDFKFVEIFVIEKRLSNSPSRRVGF
jgi:hypothetical protein